MRSSTWRKYSCGLIPLSLAEPTTFTTAACNPTTCFRFLSHGRCRDGLWMPCWWSRSLQWRVDRPATTGFCSRCYTLRPRWTEGGTKRFAFVGLENEIARTLQATGMPAHLFEVELTESMSMDKPERTMAILRKLKDMGVTVAIDDFGTGYSNLAYLKRFPIDRLKLDRAFVRDLAVITECGQSPAHGVEFHAGHHQLRYSLLYEVSNETAICPGSVNRPLALNRSLRRYAAFRSRAVSTIQLRRERQRCRAHGRGRASRVRSLEGRLCNLRVSLAQGPANGRGWRTRWCLRSGANAGAGTRVSLDRSCR